MTQRPEDIFGSEDTGRDEDGGFGRRDERGGRPRVSDFVRRAIENTVGSVQNSGNAPREALEYLLKQGDRGRRELFRIVAGEVGDFLKHVDVAGEVVKVLTSVEVEFKANLRFKPSDNALKVEPTPDSDVSMHVTPLDRAEGRPEQQRPEARPSVAPPRPRGSGSREGERATGEYDTEEPR